MVASRELRRGPRTPIRVYEVRLTADLYRWVLEMSAVAVRDGIEPVALLTPEQRSWLLRDTEEWVVAAQDSDDQRRVTLLTDLQYRLDAAQDLTTQPTATPENDDGE
jgi:hypothetical protein